MKRHSIVTLVFLTLLALPLLAGENDVAQAKLNIYAETPDVPLSAADKAFTNKLIEEIKRADTQKLVKMESLGIVLKSLSGVTSYSTIQKKNLMLYGFLKKQKDQYICEVKLYSLAQNKVLQEFSATLPITAQALTTLSQNLSQRIVAYFYKNEKELFPLASPQIAQVKTPQTKQKLSREKIEPEKIEPEKIEPEKIEPEKIEKEAQPRWPEEKILENSASFNSKRLYDGLSLQVGGGYPFLISYTNRLYGLGSMDVKLRVKIENTGTINQWPYVYPIVTGNFSYATAKEQPLYVPTEFHDMFVGVGLGFGVEAPHGHVFSFTTAIGGSVSVSDINRQYASAIRVVDTAFGMQFNLSYEYWPSKWVGLGFNNKIDISFHQTWQLYYEPSVFLVFQLYKPLNTKEK